MTRLSDEIKSDMSALEDALRQADSSGDSELAKKVASSYRKAQRRLDTITSNPAEYDPTSEAYQKKYGATQGFLSNLAAGAGKAVVDTGRGIQDLAVDAANLVPGVNLDDTAARLDQRASDVRQRDSALMGTGGGLTGNIAGNVASFMLPAAGLAKGAQAVNATRGAGVLSGLANPTTFGAAIGSGALQGAIAPTTENDSRASNTLIGGASGLAGQALASGLGRLAQPVTRRAAGSADDAARLLQREGVDLDVVQKTGSQMGQRVRSALADNPLTGAGQRRFADKQQAQFTRAVLRTAGIDGDELSPKLLNDAIESIGSKIDDAANTNPAVLDNVAINQINDILVNAPDQGVDDAVLRGLYRNAEKLQEAIARNDGVVPGPVFTSVRSNLSGLSKKTPLAREIENVLLDALDRSGGSSSTLKDALGRYRNIKIIEGAVDKGAEKYVSPLRLSNALGTKANRNLSLRNLGSDSSVKLANLAAAGRELLPEAFANSGTAGRLLATEGLLAGAGGLTAAATGQDLEGILAAGAGAAALPLLLQRGLLSQGGLGNYLSNGMAPGATRSLLSSPAAQGLLTQGAISSGLTETR